jgi:hypothetical protein
MPGKPTEHNHKDDLRSDDFQDDFQQLFQELLKPEALKSLYRSPGNKKNQLVLCKKFTDDRRQTTDAK